MQTENYGLNEYDKEFVLKLQRGDVSQISGELLQKLASNSNVGQKAFSESKNISLFWSTKQKIFEKCFSQLTKISHQESMEIDSNIVKDVKCIHQLFGDRIIRSL